MANRMFGTAGIRGLTNLEITPQLALVMSAVFADEIGARGGAMLVGRDTRWGAEMLATASTAGLLSAGMNVLDAGVITTGGFATYLTRRRLAGGVLITGSHTPPDRIGYIAMMPDGAYVPDAVAARLEAAYERALRGERPAPPPVKDRIGTARAADGVIETYMDALMAAGDVERIRARRFRVLVDPVNGTAAGPIQDLLRRLGCEVFEINGARSPEFGRPSEPRAATLGPAAAATLAHRCDLGLGTDVDADRILFIDETGAILSEDLVGALFADDLLPRVPAPRVCSFPIKSSGLIELVCARHGARIVDCAPGQPSIVEAVKAAGAAYAYEESGKYYFCREALWCDALLATVKLLDLLVRSGKSLSAAAAPYPRFFQVKHMVHCDDRIKAAAMEEVRRLWSTELTDGRVKDVTVDGLKRVYQDNSWLLIRKSGTEPLVRVYSDATTTARAEELVGRGEALLARAMAAVAGR
ncbi:MAG: hypothetical protein HZA54_17435 [Planctomycetes bacterium]|nr:hypothetical protein [Planctomycetota bacterium]